MTTIVTRAGKGSPLTNSEMDLNLTNLNTDKLEKSSNLSDLTNAANARSNIGLGNVDNTSDTTKNAASATLTNKSFGSAVTITDNSANPALKVIQTGSGNALLIGTSVSQTVQNPINGVAHTFRTQLSGVSASDGMAIIRNNDTNTAGGCVVVARSRGTAAAPTPIVSGDAISKLGFQGHDGTQFLTAASIGVDSDGVVATGAMPGRLVFSTTADGASVSTERMRIDSAGRVLVGDHVAGSLTAGSASMVISKVDNPLLTIVDNAQGSLLLGVQAGTGFIGVDTGSLKFRTGCTYNDPTTGTERMRIDSAGHALVGGTSPCEAYGRTTLASLHSTGGLIEVGVPAGRHGIVYWNEAGNSLAVEARSTNSEVAITSNGTGNIKLFSGSSGSVLMHAPGGFGYGTGTGAGGTVTQVTSKATAVTLNKPTGQITMHNAALAAGASVTFLVSNSLLSTNDNVFVTSNNSASYRVEWFLGGVNIFYVRVTNITAGSLSESAVLNFTILKGAIA